jgi:glycosyltransferase involved in cell wall biosynthesis
MTAKTIVHISCDFPDTMVPEKTRSVRNLIDAIGGYRQVVYSLNRVNALSGIEKVDFAEDRAAIAYGAPPKGILLDTVLARVADWLYDDIVARGIEVALIHAHKFTVEGLIAIRLAHKLGVPFVANIWGDTDLRILGARRDLRAKWAAIAGEAQALLVYAPWTIDKFAALVPFERSKAIVLPPIIFHENFRASAPMGNNRFVTLFNLDAYRRKNFPGLVAAIQEIARTRPDIRLDVFGAGSPKTILAMTKVIHRADMAQHIRLMGKIDNQKVGETLNRYVGFLMPTRRETFGMVFIEAMFTGLPVLHSRGWGIDGSFGTAAVGYACDPTDHADIVRGIETLIADEAALKANLVQLAATQGLDAFKRANIAREYEALLARLTAKSTGIAAETQFARAG